MWDFYLRGPSYAFTKFVQCTSTEAINFFKERKKYKKERKRALHKSIGCGWLLLLLYVK
jgi:hypothetical protein